jgi:hypothetical protein
MNITPEQIEKLRKEFKFKYVGGGYFRDGTFAKGVKSECVHGEEILNLYTEYLIKSLTKEN